MHKITDITEQRFGKLTAIKYSYTRQNKSNYFDYWLCKCDCGGEKIASNVDLKSGRTKSCGCLLKKEKPIREKDNLTGKQFGRLIVLSYSHSKDTRRYWLCKCSCGNEKTILGSNLTKGITKSCGCLNRELSSERTKDQIINISGQKFGRLTAIKLTNKKSNRITWLCKCDCGNEIPVTQNSLQRGDTRSCGCLRKELLIEHIAKINKHQKGENHPAYKPDLTDEERTINRDFRAYKKWRLDIYKKDDFTCQCCNRKHSDRNPINAHHIINYRENKELSLDINNGITLCEECHKSFHKLYGYRHNNKIQLDEFLILQLQKNKYHVDILMDIGSNYYDASGI